MASTQFARWLTLTVCLIARVATAQDNVNSPSLEERLSDPVYLSWIAREDVQGCVQCHFRGPTDDELIGGSLTGSFTDFARRTEMDRWLTQDKHTIARRRVEPFSDQQSEAQLDALIARINEQQDRAITALRKRNRKVDVSQVGFTKVPEQWIGDSNILSRRICDKVWGVGSTETEDGYAKFRDNCLTCHGGYQSGDTGFDLATVDQSQLGIDCLYCHQVGQNQKWVQDHASPDAATKWRLLPPDVKSAAGMRDLVNTSNQATLCLDCHVGNRSKNMFVTHEMYAAGHPPIPSIELQTFCEQMPQHWQTPSQLWKSLAEYPGREEYFRANFPGLTANSSPDKVFWSTRKLLIGALTARVQLLDLYIASANNNQWADYSLYDCAACHHELQSESRRQQRYLVNDSANPHIAPGRPRQSEWPDSILRIAYVFDGKTNLPRTLELENKLEFAFGAEPFGDPDQVKEAAENLRQHLIESIRNVETKPVSASIAKAVLRGLSTTPEDALLTYDSARQVVWAMLTISKELRAEGMPLSTEAEAMILSLGDPSVTGIESDLPAGRGQFIYPQELESDLFRRADFDPSKLKSRLTQIQALLAATEKTQ